MTSKEQEFDDESLRRAMRETAKATRDDDLYDFDILVRKAGQAYWRAREQGFSPAEAEKEAADSADDLKQSELIREVALEQLRRSSLDRFIGKHFVKLLVVVPPAVAMVAIVISWFLAISIDNDIGYIVLAAAGGLWLLYGIYGLAKLVIAKIRAAPAPSRRGSFALAVAGSPYGFLLITTLGLIVLQLREINMEESFRKIVLATGVIFNDPVKFPRHSLAVAQTSSDPIIDKSKETVPNLHVAQATAKKSDVPPAEMKPDGAKEDPVKLKSDGGTSALAVNSDDDAITSGPRTNVSIDGSKAQKVVALPDKAAEELVHQFTNANWIHVTPGPILSSDIVTSGPVVLTANLPWDPRAAELRMEVASEGAFKGERTIAMYMKWPWNRGEGRKYATYMYGEVVGLDNEVASVRMSSGKVHKMTLPSTHSNPALSQGALVVTSVDSRSSKVQVIGRVDGVAERVAQLTGAKSQHLSP